MDLEISFLHKELSDPFECIHEALEEFSQSLVDFYDFTCVNGLFITNYGVNIAARIARKVVEFHSVFTRILLSEILNFNDSSG